MSEIQEIEINRYQKRITKDMKHLVERYREIMTWDVPDSDPAEADKLIFKAVHSALDEVENS